MGSHRTVGNIMNRKLLYLREGDRLTLARSKILELGITAVPILDDAHRPVGVVTLRELQHEPVVASTTIHTVNAAASILEGARILARNDLHHLVVVDSEGIAVGMVSAVDFVRELAGLAPHHPAGFDQL